MPTITPAQLIELQKKQTGIRNICILAHVDHGKTTLSDSLLASNGIISSKLSGKVRYLDSREDEQQRGITMKSSGISLFFRILQQAAGGQDTVTEDYLINLIDSPGHVDFSSEVSTASRLCDGALVLVDAVEGVCTQTHTVLRQAWQESVRPILVLNKVDRLITELKLSPTEAYTHMNKILEQVNAIMGTFHNENMMEADAARYEAHKARQQARGDDQEGGDEGLEWQLQQQDDSNLYFSPELGNVLFASAIDGWAFRTKQFAQIYAAKLGIREELLKRFLWGDFYLDPKTKRVVGSKGLKGRNLKPLFVQFILDNLWAVYDAVMNSNASEREKVEKIVKALSIKVLPRDMKSKDNRYLLQIIMSQWLSLSSSVLLTVVDKLPNPIEAQQLRMPKILQVTGGVSTLRGNEEFEKLEKALRDCDAGEDAPTVAYVSKMFSVPADMLPSNRRVQLSAEEMRERRREALRRQQEGAAGKAAGEGKLDNQTSPPITLKDDEGNPVSTPPTDAPTEPATKPPTGDALVGFARIYSGTIKTGQTIHVLGPKFDPAHPDRYRTEVKVDKLYLMMGRELQALEEVPAGNIFAIGGLEDVVLKTGTLSSVRECVSFGGLRMEAPIVRVAVEPRDPTRMAALAEGLRLLNQADPCVEIMMQETGEQVILCAGELHLERCLKDLRESFAKIDIQVSPPIVPFRETISDAPSIVPAQQAQQFGAPKADTDEPTTKEHLPLGTIILHTPNKLATVRVRALPVPTRITDFLNKESQTVRAAVDERDRSGGEGAGGESGTVGDAFIERLDAVVKEAVAEGEVQDREFWGGAVERIWAFGPKRVGPNLLVNGMKDYSRPLWSKASASRPSRQRTHSTQPGDAEEVDDVDVISEVEQAIADVSIGDVDVGNARRGTTVKEYDGNINTGFQLSTFVGPLCGEPVVGVCYVVEDVSLDIGEDVDSTKLGLLSGQIISTVKEACRQAFLAYSPRLMLAMYSCDLQAPAEVLGKVYAVLARRRGRILSEEMKEGTPFFNIRSMLPVVESFGFSDDIRKRTSGAASPQLIFSGFEILDQDPFWVPTTEEELEDLGEKADRENLAKKYMESVRKRKGMAVEKKIVEHAEKQKTLKNK